MEVQALAAMGLYFTFFTCCFILHNYGFYVKFACLNFIYNLLSLGSHENIVGYYSSWFENEHLYIQMELCDHSLSINKCSALLTEGQVLDALYQVNILSYFLTMFDETLVLFFITQHIIEVLLLLFSFIF